MQSPGKAGEVAAQTPLFPSITPSCQGCPVPCREGLLGDALVSMWCSLVTMGVGCSEAPAQSSAGRETQGSWVGLSEC